MSTAYTVVSFDLSVARTQMPIDGTVQNPVDAVYVIALPAAVSLHFGVSGSPWPAEAGKSYEPCPPERDGIAISNVAAGGLLVLGIGYAIG